MPLPLIEFLATMRVFTIRQFAQITIAEIHALTEELLPSHTAAVECVHSHKELLKSPKVLFSLLFIIIIIFCVSFFLSLSPFLYLSLSHPLFLSFYLFFYLFFFILK